MGRVMGQGGMRNGWSKAGLMVCLGISYKECEEGKAGIEKVRGFGV